jgi:hypothetical protein
MSINGSNQIVNLSNDITNGAVSNEVSLSTTTSDPRRDFDAAKKRLDDNCREEDFGVVWRLDLLKGLNPPIHIDRKSKHADIGDLKKQLEKVTNEVNCGDGAKLPSAANEMVTPQLIEEYHTVGEKSQKLSEGLTRMYNSLDSLLFVPQRNLGSYKSEEVEVSKEFAQTLSSVTKTLKTVEELKQSTNELKRLLNN